MKTTLLGLMAIVLLWAQPLSASSAVEGGEKHKQKEVNNPSGQSHLESMPLGAANELQTIAPSEIITNTEVVSTATQIVDDAPAATSKIVKSEKHKVKPMKVLREARKHDSSNIFGILALILGILGFLLAWVLWPVGLLFGISAIVLGAIGLSGGRDGRGMAIVGLVFGILTIVIPVLIIALIIAIFI